MSLESIADRRFKKVSISVKYVFEIAVCSVPAVALAKNSPSKDVLLAPTTVAPAASTWAAVAGVVTAAAAESAELKTSLV